MEGLVTGYSGTSLAINVDAIGGSGAKSDWNINVAGNGAAASHSVGFAPSMSFAGTSTTFDLFKTTLTGVNSSASLTGNTNEMMELDILQDGIGHTFSAPPNIIPACPVNTNPNVTTIIKGSFDGVNLLQSGCTNNDTATFMTGPERAPVITTSAGQGTFTFENGSHTLGYYANNSPNRHAIPRCAGSTDQCASTDLSDAANINLLNSSQTVSGNKTMTGSLDASGATHTLPVKSGLGASKPASCTIGEVYFATDATAGQNFYFCTATNTFTQQLNSGGATALVGQSGTIAALPATCTVGQLYFATNATAGQNIYECAATNAWTQQLNGGGAGANITLSNLGTTSINAPLLPQTNQSLGSAGANWNDLFLNLSGTFGTGYVHFTGTPTAARTIKVADANTATIQPLDCTGTGATAGQMITKIDANGLPTCSSATPRYSWANNMLNSTIIASTTSFTGVEGSAGFNTGAVTRQLSVPIAGTLKNLRMATNGLQPATGAGAIVCTVQTAALGNAPSFVSSAITVTFASGSNASTQSDTTHTASVNAGDLVVLQCVNSGTGSSAGFNLAALDLFGAN